ncbi:MAG: hypothetical protein AB8E82_15110 [Aureispira sp.]
MKPILSGLLLLFCLYACTNETASTNTTTATSYQFPIQNLSDKDYPDNPDIGFRATEYVHQYFTQGRLVAQGDNHYQLSFYNTTDSLFFEHLDVSEFIPTIPNRLKEDEYLSLITCVNQEWNRNQVQFGPADFECTNAQIVRVDVARNCLNAYLWEVILYIEENGKKVPYAHGWFNFPKDLYATLFQAKNGQEFSQYQKYLENWVDPPSQPVALQLLRQPLAVAAIAWVDSSNAMYPVAGARQKKFKEIITPEVFATMRDLQSDQTTFATFTPPGFYNKKDPRTTELGRFKELKHAQFFQTISTINGDTLCELQLLFQDSAGTRNTQLVFGGLNVQQFPVLPSTQANQGWKTSMGFANHTFYEKYAAHLTQKTNSNPYYGYLATAKGSWLDSHRIGIDGPIFHFSDSERKILHLWLLSFERHALVGHYIFKLP